MKPFPVGASASVVADVQRVLAKHYGEKALEVAGMNQLIAAIGDAERAYAALPDAPKRGRKRNRPTEGS